jgi:hypothetical protein
LSPHENSILNQLTDEIRGYREEVTAYRQDVAVLHTKLFGDKDAENPKGRIPILESTLAAHGRRLKKVEPIVLILRGVWALLLMAGGAILNHFIPIKGH